MSTGIPEEVTAANELIKRGSGRNGVKRVDLRVAQKITQGNMSQNSVAALKSGKSSARLWKSTTRRREELGDCRDDSIKRSF
jgi:hypothetical protein